MTAKRRLISNSSAATTLRRRTGGARRRLGVAALAVTFAGVALLAGCTPPPVKPQAAPPAKLHPVGDRGHWIKDTYSGWLGETYSTPNTVCGIADDTVVEFEEGGDPRANRVVARSLATSRILWQLENGRCSVGSVGQAEALIGVTPQGRIADAQWRTVDPSTGQTIQDLHFTKTTYLAEPVTEAGQVKVYLTDGAELIGVESGKEIWRSRAEGNATATALADGLIGISPGLQKELRVIDGATGKDLHTAKVQRYGEITWASDGYSSRINQSDPEYAFFDVNGTEVDRTKGVSQYGFVPRGREGVTFPIADHVAAGRVVGVAADGTPALFQDARQKNFTPAGEIRDLPDSIIGLAALSENGKVLVFTTSPTSDTSRLVAINQEGQTNFTFDLKFSELRVESGYLVLTSDHSTHVLLPPT